MAEQLSIAEQIVQKFGLSAPECILVGMLTTARMVGDTELYINLLIVNKLAPDHKVSLAAVDLFERIRPRTLTLADVVMMILSSPDIT